MEENIGEDMHYVGLFNIDGNQIQGEIIHDIQNGVILLVVRFEFDFSEGLPEKPSRNPSFIEGRLTNGTIVNLYNNKLVKNLTQNFKYQEIQYIVKYMIWSYKELPNPMFDKITCELENGLEWSGLTGIEKKELTNFIIKSSTPKTFYWYGVKIDFFTSIKNELTSLPRKEVCEIVERLVITIESDEKKNINFFIDIKDKVLSLISFAIHDNINVIEQYFTDNNDFESIGNYNNYSKYWFIDNKPVYNIHYTHPFDYNFSLNNLSDDDSQLSEKLERLTPIFNLYLSLFKYPYMPTEMIFLNVVQALETLHSRFFSDNDKKKYVQYVEERFEKGSLHYNLLLSNTQMDKNCSYIILSSRLNDLLIRGQDDLFAEFYMGDNEFAQRIADTRHYYTHYGESKRSKALKGDNLLNAIMILKLLLEYHVCDILKINIDQHIAENLYYYNSNKVD